MRLGKKTDAKYLKRIGDYTFGDSIGEGCSSMVRKATDLSGAVYAVKIIPKLKMADATVAKHFQSEIRVNQQLHHPGVVHVQDIIKDPLFYYVIMEYCPGGSLTHHIRDHKRVDITECQILLKQLLITLEYLHGLGICHRDLKPDNILLDSRRNCKISDFGLAMFCAGGRMCRETLGTPGYYSPESLSGNPYDGRRSDIWSLGIVFYSMVTGGLPWDTRNQKQMANQIKRGRFEIPTHFGDDVARVLRKMLTMNPANRATAKELLEDPWISGCVYRSEVILPTRMLSLRQVDNFFGKDKVEVEFGIVKVIPRSLSMMQLTVEKTLAALGEDAGRERPEEMIVKAEAGTPKRRRKKKRKIKVKSMGMIQSRAVRVEPEAGEDP